MSPMAETLVVSVGTGEDFGEVPAITGPGNSCVVENALAAVAWFDAAEEGDGVAAAGEGAAAEGGEGIATGAGDGEGTAVSVDGEAAGAELGEDDFCSGTEGSGFVSCVRKSEEMGSIVVLGGIGCTGGGAGEAGVDSTTWIVGVLAGGEGGTT